MISNIFLYYYLLIFYTQLYAFKLLILIHYNHVLAKVIWFHVNNSPEPVQENVVKLGTVVEGDPKAPSLIATTPR